MCQRYTLHLAIYAVDADGIEAEQATDAVSLDLATSDLAALTGVLHDLAQDAVVALHNAVPDDLITPRWLADADGERSGAPWARMVEQSGGDPYGSGLYGPDPRDEAGAPGAWLDWYAYRESEPDFFIPECARCGAALPQDTEFELCDACRKER